MGPPAAPGTSIGNDITSGLNPLQPAGTPTMATIPGQNAPIPIYQPGVAAPAKGYSDPNGLGTGPSAMQRALDAATGSIPRSSAPPVTGSLAPAITQVPSSGGTSGPAGSSPISSTPIAPTPIAPTPIAPTGAGSSPINNSGAPTDTGAGSLQGLTGSIMQQIQGISSGLSSPGTPIDATAVYMKQSQSILEMLNQQEASLRSDAQKQGTTIDPATQFTLDKLRQTLEDNMKSTREDLNRRGLYDSGILLQLENNLQKGNASDQAMVLSQRLSKLQDELNAGLTAIRGQRYSTANQFGLAAGNAQTSADTQSRTLAYDREQAALQAMLSLRGQQSGEQQAAASLAQQNAQFNSTQQFTASQNALQRAAAAAATAAGRTTTGGTNAPGTANSGGDVRVQQAVASLTNTYNNREDAQAAIVAQGAMLASTIGAAGIAALEAAANSLPSKTSVTGNIGGGTRS